MAFSKSLLVKEEDLNDDGWVAFDAGNDSAFFGSSKDFFANSSSSSIDNKNNRFAAETKEENKEDDAATAKAKAREEERMKAVAEERRQRQAEYERRRAREEQFRLMKEEEMKRNEQEAAARRKEQETQAFLEANTKVNVQEITIVEFSDDDIDEDETAATTPNQSSAAVSTARVVTPTGSPVSSAPSSPDRMVDQSDEEAQARIAEAIRQEELQFHREREEEKRRVAEKERLAERRRLVEERQQLEAKNQKELQEKKRLAAQKKSWLANKRLADRKKGKKKTKKDGSAEKKKSKGSKTRRGWFKKMGVVSEEKTTPAPQEEVVKTEGKLKEEEVEEADRSAIYLHVEDPIGRPKSPTPDFDDGSASDVTGSDFSDSGSESDAGSDSDSDSLETLETKDTKETYTTKGTYETLNTKQYEEFLKQEKKEEGWSSFFCGVFGRATDENDDEQSQTSISTRTKPVGYGSSVAGTSLSKTTYGTDSRATLSVVDDDSDSDSDSSQGFGSEYTGETEELPPMKESSFIF